MSFTHENIENAVKCLQDSNSPDQQEAHDFIYEWGQQTDSIITALDMIGQTSSFNNSFIYSALIKNKLPNYWGKLEADQKNKYREQLMELIFAVPDIDNHISYDLIHALCYIAAYDWPEDFPNFSDVILPSENSQTIKTSIRILSSFMEEVDSTNIITDQRRNNLRQTIIANLHEKIMEIIRNYITKEEYSVDVLNICNYLLRWGSTEDIVDFELFQKLACEFIANEKTCKNAVQCLTTIFISRTDSAIAFRTLSPFLANALSKGVFPNQKPVTSDHDVIRFLLKFLFEYSTILELVLNYDDAKNDSKVNYLIDENVSLLVETMKEKGISPETLHEDLVNLYQIILSIPLDVYDDLQVSFWQLWDNNLRRVSYEQTHEMSVKSSSNFFMPFMEEITQSLYNSLAESIDEEGICIFQARTAIGSLYTIDPDIYINFLKAQPPSPQLCYAIGTIEFVVSKSKLDSILLLIIELMQYVNDHSEPEYQVALLYGLSHSTKCFESNNQLFSQFIDYACTSMTGNEKIVADAATHALQYVVQRRAGLFKGECRYYAEILIGNSEAYLQNLEHSSAVRIFKVCTWLICYNRRSNQVEKIQSHIVNGIEIIQVTTSDESSNKEEESSTQSLYEKLFEPIGAVISQPDQFPDKIVETALDVIRECCYASPSSVSYIYELLWPVVFELAGNSIPSPNIQNSTLSYILSAMSAMQVGLKWEQVGPQVEEVFQMMQSSKRYEDCFYEYLEILRSIFKEMDPLYPTIYQELIVPLTSSDEPLPPSLFLMISQFTPDVVDIEWLSMLVIRALNDFRTDVGDDALNAIQSMIYNLKRENLIKFLQQNAPQLISALIESIIDLMHKPLFSRSIDFLRFIITNSDFKTEDEDLQTSVKQIISSSLSQCAEEPEEGFFDNFAEYLMSVQKQFYKFKSAFANLLIVLKKASPGDGELFKVEPVQQNSLLSMIFDNFFRDMAPVFEIQVLNNDGKMISNARPARGLRFRERNKNIFGNKQPIKPQ